MEVQLRNSGLDVSRGILMMYIIVIIHGVFYLKFLPRPYSTVLLLEMPLIFLISGYAFALSNPNNTFSVAYYLRYLKTRMLRIMLPYLIYAFACACLVMIFSSDFNRLNTLWLWLNPITHGKGATYYWLNQHLWFVPSFLVVTLLLPFFNLHVIKKIPTNLSILVLCLIFVLFSFYMSRFAASPSFYLLWAFVGFKLGAGANFSDKKRMLAVFATVITLLLNFIVFDIDLDMQNNKFPPNLTFFVFSIFWVALLLLAADRVPQRWVDRLNGNAVVHVFIAFGYSLYLWQGLGYSIAVFLQEKFQFNVLLIWMIAIILTIVFGLIASPIEKVRWKKAQLS